MDQKQMARELIGYKFHSLRLRDGVDEVTRKKVRELVEMANQYEIDLSQVAVDVVEVYDVSSIPDEDREYVSSIQEVIVGRINWQRDRAIDRLTPTQRREFETLSQLKEVPQSPGSRRTYDILVDRGLARVGPMSANPSVSGYHFVAQATLADLLANPVAEDVGTNKSVDTTRH